MAPADPSASFKRITLEFLDTEMKLAHTFLDSAEISQDPERIVRAHQDARTAYETILHFLPAVDFLAEERLEFGKQLEILRNRLVDTGIQV